MAKSKSKKKLEESTRLAGINWQETSGVDLPANQEQGWVVMKSRNRGRRPYRRRTGQGRPLTNAEKASLLGGLSSSLISLIAGALGVNPKSLMNTDLTNWTAPKGTKPGQNFKAPNMMPGKAPSKPINVGKKPSKTQPPHKSGTSNSKPKAQSTSVSGGKGGKTNSGNRGRKRAYTEKSYWEWEESTARGDIVGRIHRRDGEYHLNLVVDSENGGRERLRESYRSLALAKRAADSFVGSRVRRRAASRYRK